MLHPLNCYLHLRIPRLEELLKFRASTSITTKELLPNSNIYNNKAGPTGPASLLPLELIAKERLCYKCNNLILLNKFSLLRIYSNIFAACKCLNLLITIVGLYAAYYITLLNRSAYNRSC